MRDKALIKACHRGEKQAFDELIRLYYPYVFRFLRKVSGEETLAEDLTQETFLKMIRGIEGYDPNGRAQFSTWLLTIARNNYVDSLRQKGQFQEMTPENEPISYDSAELALRRLQYEDALREADLLPPEQRLAFRLRYEEELTLAEISERAGVSPKTVKSRIHEATVTLRKSFAAKERRDFHE